MKNKVYIIVEGGLVQEIWVHKSLCDALYGNMSVLNIDTDAEDYEERLMLHDLISSEPGYYYVDHDATITEA